MTQTPADTTTFDIVILGAGSGGYAAALRAAQLGKTVALIEKEKVGGTCLHVGCVPTKALLHVAEVADEINHSDTVGITSSLESIDLKGVLSFKDGIVSRLYSGLQGLIKAAGITVVEGEGKLVGPKAVEVNGQTHALLSPLTEVQTRLLELWGLPPDLYEKVARGFPIPPVNTSEP